MTMKDNEKTKEQLLKEIKVLKKQIAELEKLKSKHNESRQMVIESNRQLQENSQILYDTQQELKISAEKEKKLAVVNKRRTAELEIAYSNLKRVQAQIVQTERIVAMGVIVAGVAHELNNPMMGMINYTQYCLAHTSEDDKRYDVLKNMERETRRCIGIVKNLLIFSHKGKGGSEGLKKTSCTDIFEHVLKFYSYRIKESNVSVTKNYAKGIPEIWMHIDSIQQVFLNLISNAFDALKESERKELQIDIFPEGGFVNVTVADTGCGINPENLGIIMEPFFTTKPIGQGTGLGLSIANTIISNHGGKITCESKVGQGTKFTILLPIEKMEDN